MPLVEREGADEFQDSIFVPSKDTWPISAIIISAPV